jgi:hypothetical protein
MAFRSTRRRCGPTLRRRAGNGKKQRPPNQRALLLTGAGESRSTIGLARRYAINIRPRDADIGKLAVT